MIEEMSPSRRHYGDRHASRADGHPASPHDFFRGTRTPGAWRSGFNDAVQGFVDGPATMIGIGVATASRRGRRRDNVTGSAMRMTEFVEFRLQGNVIVMLLFIAFVCLVLGLGVPTTANYVLVATLMAPVVVELGAQADW